VKKAHQSLSAGLVDFADSTFLLLGESDAFYWLADQIEGRSAVAVEGVPSKGIARLSIVPTTKEGQEGRVSRAGLVLEWQMSSSEAVLVSQQLRELATGSSPAHVYLDPACNLAGVQIMASKGEYDPERVFAR
jgi:hypothetical protein